LLERDIFDLFLPEFDKPWVIHLRETCCCSTNLYTWRPNTVYKNRSVRRHQSMRLILLSAGLMLTDEFASLEEPTEDSEVATAAVLLADGPKKIGSKRQRQPRDSTQKLKLPIVRSISRSRFAKNGTRVGGCQSSNCTVDKGKKAIDSMTLAPKIPTVGAN
jgi:hypothetical protein